MKNTFFVDDYGMPLPDRRRIRKWTNYSRELDSKPERNTWSDDLDLHCLIHFKRKGVPLPLDNCVPDMVMSMQDIYERYSTNREIPSVLASYDSDELDALMPDFSRMSKVELIDLMKQNNKRIEAWREAKQAADDASAQKALDERNAEFERLRGVEAKLLKEQEMASFVK